MGDSFSVLSTGLKEPRPNNSKLFVLLPHPHITELKNGDYSKGKTKHSMIQGVFYLGNSEHLKITLRRHNMNTIPAIFTDYFEGWMGHSPTRYQIYLIPHWKLPPKAQIISLALNQFRVELKVKEMKGHDKICVNSYWSDKLKGPD